ncbi:MAG TPA: hypothetical protein VG758_27030, partial [Hyphomicrobiaceae bacterium]|nr:hypothetical protein [Hyphomicrobiaceae bacterium]
VSHITVPVDMQSQPVKSAQRSERNLANHVSDIMVRSAQMASDDQIARAASILNGGKKTVVLAGRGALDARSELLAVAERLAAPIVKPLLGKGAVPDDSPFSTGGIGLLGTKPSQEALEGCDTLLIVGSSFPYIEGTLEEYVDEFPLSGRSIRSCWDGPLSAHFFALRGVAGAGLRNATQTPPTHSAQAGAAAIRSSWTRRRML